MASSSSSSKPKGCYETRSISLPPRSHPSTLLIQEELNKLKSYEASSSSLSSSSSSSSVSIGLSGLGELHRRIEDLLKLPLIQQALSNHLHQKWINELLDDSVMFLDICETTRDTLLSIKETIRELRSSLRRRKAGDIAIETDVTAYISLRRRTRKETETSLASLKQIDKKTEHSVLETEYSVSCSGTPLFLPVRVLREANFATRTVLGSLLSFISAAAPARSSRWSLVVARLVHRRESLKLNQLEDVEVALSNLTVKDGEAVEGKIWEVKKKLKALEDAIEELEDGLECLFRRLIHNRVSFLNILSK